MTFLPVGHSISFLRGHKREVFGVFVRRVCREFSRLRDGNLGRCARICARIENFDRSTPMDTAIYLPIFGPSALSWVANLWTQYPSQRRGRFVTHGFRVLSFNEQVRIANCLYGHGSEDSNVLSFRQGKRKQNHLILKSPHLNI
jgi:hypothetical protein